MAVAVLKNRLLLLTRGAFSETAFGAQTFPEFVLRDAEITRLDIDMASHSGTDCRPAATR
jgi:hypothetical protein